MRASELIREAEASDAELALRWPNYKPQDRAMSNYELPADPGPTLWSCREVIQDILGRDNVYDLDVNDDDGIKPGMYVMFSSSGHSMFRATGDTNREGGSIEVPDLDSHSAHDVGIAAHEAYHAWAHKKSPGSVYTNEKIVNNAAAKWLREHLTGPSLHYALEAITKSKISYGPHHIPKGSVKDQR